MKIQFNSVSLEYLTQQWDAMHQELSKRWEDKRRIDSEVIQMLHGKTRIEFRVLSVKLDKSYAQMLASLKELTFRVKKANLASKELDEKM